MAKKFTKKRDAFVSCFANIYVLLFCRSRCRRRRRCLSSLLLWSRNFATMVAWHYSSLSRFSSSFNNVITPASQWSANTHFTLSITPFVIPHPWATYPAHFHLINAMCLSMSFTHSAVTNFLWWSLCLRFIDSIFLSIALCADLSFYLMHSGFF